jgi:hypothetical protein
MGPKSEQIEMKDLQLDVHMNYFEIEGINYHIQTV